MSEKALKLKKGGLDTIIAYIVVMLPLLYVLVYIIATIYHFSVQMYMNQVVKERIKNNAITRVEKAKDKKVAFGRDKDPKVTLRTS